jgi:nucleoside-diphosphate-sugar epimerase
MRVLVTGASGFLGSHIVERLAREGHTVRALVRKTSQRKHLEALPNVELAFGSVEEKDRVREAMHGVDAVVHAAALVKARSADEFRRTNVEGTVNLLEAARTEAPKLRRFVLVSSLAVCGPSHDGHPVPLEREPQPLTSYGRTKLEAEREAVSRAAEVPVTVLRIAAIYGPRDVEIFKMFQAVNRRILPTIGRKESSFSVVYVEDAAAACVRAITADVPSGSVYFVDDGKIQRLGPMLETIEDAVGKKALLRINLPMPVVYGAAVATELFGKLTNRAVMVTREKVSEFRQPHWVCSSEKTRAELGWTPEVPFAEGARRTARWYRENGWL